jgi:hypothetical protein
MFTDLLRPAKAGRYLLLLILASGCSSSTTTPSAAVTTPSTFVMTWPTLAFAQTAVGVTAATPIAVTLSNYGAAPVPVASVTDTNVAEFPFTTTCSVGGSLAPNSTCAVSTRFIPGTTGARTATLTINANSTAQTFDLTGTGVAAVKPQLSIDPTTGPPSTLFTLSITGATPSGTLTLNTIYTAPGAPGVPSSTPGWAIDTNGNATIASNSDNVGSYESWVIDNTTGASSNHVTHTVK